MSMASLFRNIVTSRYQQIRFLPRFSQSRPEKNEVPRNPWEEDIEKNSGLKETVHKETSNYALNQNKIKWRSKVSQPVSLVIKSTSEKQQLKSEKPQMLAQKLKKNAGDMNPVIDSQGNLIYTKMQNNDPRVNKIMTSVKTRKKGNEFMLLEGKRLIKEALEAGCQLEYLLFSRMKEVEYLKPYFPKVGRLYKMPYKEMQMWSDLTTNPGIMGVFKVPPSDFVNPKEALPLTIICDNIREPNNLGAILRTSSGVACERVVLTKGCVNVWDTKVLRTACGAHFRVRISNEANWQDIRSKLPKNANVFIADNSTISSSNENIDFVGNLMANIPVLPYYSTNFSLSSHVVLIIGGETEGVSVESFKLAQDFNGVRLNVPLSNGVDSLNTGTALGIIAFEIKRQLSSLQRSEKVEQKC